MSFTASIAQIVEENFNGLLSQAPHWERVPLREIASIKNGIPLPSSGFNPTTGVPVIRIRNVLDGYTDTLFAGPVEEGWFVQKGDLLIGMDGDFHAARWKGPRALLNQRVCMVQPKDDRASVQFLSFVLPGYLAAVNAHTPSITVKHLSSRTVGDLPIPIPPPSEQVALVAAIETHFSRLDAAVASLTRAKANVKRARASVLKAAVEGRLVPTEAALARAEGRDYEPASTLLARILTERKAAWSASGARGKYKEPVAPDGDRPPLLPEGWTSCSLDGLATKITSGSRDWSPHYGRGKGVFLLAQNVRRRRLDLSMCQMVDPPEDDPACVRSLVQRGDLLVTIVGANTGEACRVPVDLDRHYVCQSVALIRPAETAVSGFVELWLSSDPLLRIWDQYIYGQGRPHLSFDDLRRSPVWLPPLAEQHRIVAEVDRRLSVLDALDAALDTNLARCARLRQAVLKRAFEGRLVPSDGSGDSEPARNQAAN